MNDFAIRYQPQRGMTRMAIIKDPLSIRFRNVSKTEVNLVDDKTLKVRDQIKHVWSLLTHDMPRSGMPIVIYHNLETYDIFHGSGGYLLRNLDPRSNLCLMMGRPITPHHIFYMLDNKCSWETTVSELKMTESTFQSWSRRRSWQI